MRVNLTQKALLAKHLAVMLRSGLPITEALEIAGGSAQGSLKKILKRVAVSVRSGRTFSESFGNYPQVFSGVFIHATHAGEVSGTLADNLEVVAQEMEKERELVLKIKGAMLYPAVVLLATFVLGLGLAFLVLPKIVPLFEGLRIDLPVTTRLLISFSHIVGRFGVYLVIAIFGILLFFSWALRQRIAKPLTHWVVLHLPVIRLVSHGANRARLARTLGTLLKSGITIDEAPTISKETSGNYYYAEALDKIARRISRGTRLSAELAEFPLFFPPFITRMIRVGEETGRFEETLFYLAGFYEAEVDTATKSLATVVEPLLLIVIGVVVGGLALAIITPIYQITGNIRR